MVTPLLSFSVNATAPRPRSSQFAAINRAPVSNSGKSPAVCGGPRVQAAGKFVGVPSGRQAASHSITSSARASTGVGISRPSA